jgi:CheY-like chemotaxis protein
MGFFSKKQRSIGEIRNEIRILKKELYELGGSLDDDATVAPQEKPEAKPVAEKSTQDGPGGRSSALFNTLSHELRTPLNGVLGIAELLKDKVDSPEIVTLESCAQHMRSVLHTVVNLFKIQDNWGHLPEHREWINLHDFFEQIKKYNARRALSRHLTIHIDHQDDTTRVRCDYDHLVHIIETALLASIECTEVESTGPLERLSIRWTVEDGTIRIVMENPLESLPENRGQNISKITNMESEALPERVRMEYLYWALSISLLEHYEGGMVVNKRKEGNGVRTSLGFKMEVQNASSRPLKAVDDQSQGQLSQGKRPLEALSFSIDILVCEDDPVNQHLVKLLLGRIGQKAEIVKNGQDAIDLLSTGKHFDLILMDIDMPVLDGVSTTQAIRMGEAGTDAMQIPIVAVTAFNTLSDKGKFQKIGMEYYLSKPVSLEELKSIVIDVFRKKK